MAGKVYPAPHTTPEALELARLFNEALGQGATDAVMEVSSHALAQQRVFGVPFDVAVFTNLTRDHLDYHKTMEEYFAAKRVLFEGCGTDPPRAVVTNLDDEYGAKLAPIQPEAQLRCTVRMAWRVVIFTRRTLTSHPRGTRFDIATPRETIPVFSPLIGRVNVYNILAAAAACYARGCEGKALHAASQSLTHVPGRFERVDCGQPFTVVVDYAHTDDASAQPDSAGARICLAWRQERPKSDHVFGCGGDRDRAKRPLMGEAAGRGSDFVVLTSDNPRSEDPRAIINDALVGLQRTGAKYSVEADRRKAIALAIAEARPGDIVLLAGKGHEKVQVTREGSHPFDDVRLRARSCGPPDSNECRARRGNTGMKLPLCEDRREFISASASDSSARKSHQGYSIDSRTIQPGELFFAVKGERLDGHDFVACCLEKSRCRRSRPQSRTGIALPYKTRLLAVDDTLAALQTLATAVRRALGEAADRRHRFRREDHDQRSHRACAQPRATAC